MFRGHGAAARTHRVPPLVTPAAWTLGSGGQAGLGSAAQVRAAACAVPISHCQRRPWRARAHAPPREVRTPVTHAHSLDRLWLQEEMRKRMLNERRAQEEKYSRINRLKILNQWRGSRAEIASCSCHSLRPRPPRTPRLGP